MTRLTDEQLALYRFISKLSVVMFGDNDCMYAVIDRDNDNNCLFFYISDLDTLINEVDALREENATLRRAAEEPIVTISTAAEMHPNSVATSLTDGG